MLTIIDLIEAPKSFSSIGKNLVCPANATLPNADRTAPIMVDRFGIKKALEVGDGRAESLDGAE